MDEHDGAQLHGDTLLVRLAEAVLRISEDLDLEVVLQEVVDGARSLTDARYGVITTLDEAGGLQDLVISGLAPGDRREMVAYPHGDALFPVLSLVGNPKRCSRQE